MPKTHFMKNILLLLLVVLCAFITYSQTKITLLPFGSDWKYLDDGSDQKTEWNKPGYNDAYWKTGKGKFGYGNGDETTILSYGANAREKHITTYFRKTITIPDASKFSGYKLRIKRDDGAVIYINGVKVYQTNMPTGPITSETRAATKAEGDGFIPIVKSLTANRLATGTNVIAVEVHQATASNADKTFDLELMGYTTAMSPPSDPTSSVLTRGPYLQMGNQSGVTLRWRTKVATDSKIEVGTVHGTYTLSATNPTITTEHEVRIDGLAADTKYFYRFGSSTQVLQNDVSNYFHTAPKASSKGKIRIAVFGDCGRNDNGFQEGSLNSYLNHVGNNPAELMLLLGDNAYEHGTDTEYQKNFFKPYGSSILKNHVVFSTPGNHDYGSQTVRTAPYYKNFSMPTAGECGGVPSGTEAFYSFDWGNVHFISLDSYGIEAGNSRLYDTLGPQVTWLKKDLEANTSKWTIAFWHHPPYTMGSHNSDTEKELKEIRENLLRILERNGVDLVLCGHSHDYERSYLLDNYYGKEASFEPKVHAKSSSSAKYDGTANSCPYITTGGKGNRGTVYVVSGSAGADGEIQSGYPHNAMPFSIDDGGMFYIEVENNRLDGKFLRRDGVVADKFTIFQDVGKTKDITIQAHSSARLSASWMRDHNWSTGQKSRAITVSPTANTTYQVRDSQNCITDVFNVYVTNPVTSTSLSMIKAGADRSTAASYQITPNPVKRGQNIAVQSGSNEMQEAVIVDNNGRQYQSIKFSGRTSFSTSNLPAGTYLIRFKGKSNAPVLKFVVTN